MTSTSQDNAASSSALAVELANLQASFAQLMQSYTQMAGASGVAPTAAANGAAPVSTVAPAEGDSVQSLQRSSRQIASAVRRALSQS